MIRALALALLAGLFAAGCSTQAESYESVEDLHAAVVDAGVDCDDPQQRPDAELVSASLACPDGTVLFVFDSAGDLEDWERVASQVGEVATGPNWAVTGRDAVVDAVTEQLHATRS